MSNRPTLKCDSCKGSGTVPEVHDYATEFLGCSDCRGTGDSGLFVDAIVELLEFNGFEVKSEEEQGGRQ